MQNLLRPLNKGIAFVATQIDRLPRWAQHVLFWVIMSLMTRNQFQRVYAGGDLPVDQSGFYVFWLSHLAFSMSGFYMLGYYAVPKFWNRNGGVQFTFLFLLYWQLSYLEHRFLLEFVTTYCAPPPPFVAAKLAKVLSLPVYACFTDAEAFFMNWAFNFSYVLIPLLIKAMRNEATKGQLILALERKNMNTKQEKTSMELTFLKAQINPHFLFNAFNNLYSLIAAGDKQAQHLLADLSEVMRYSLYRTSEQYVSLPGELRFLDNYVRLEGVRFGKEKTITSKLNGDPSHWLIPPMVIVTFIENAVKHGINQSIGKAWIVYTINIDPDGMFHLTVRNSVTKIAVPKTEEGGIGIANVRRRLNLLMEGQYNLVLREQPDEFSVSLTLPLKPITDLEPVYELVNEADLDEFQTASLTQNAIPV